MKKTLAKTAAVVTIVLLLLTLSGCFEDPIVGTWKGTIDFAPAFNKGVSESGEDIASMMKLDELKIDILFTFDGADAFTVTADQASVDAASAAVREDISVKLRAAYEKMLADAGADMTVEEALAHSETTFEAELQSFMDVIDVKSIAEEYDAAGKYRYESGKLMLSAGSEYEVEPESYFTVTLDGDKFTVTGSVGYDDDNDFFAGAYPIEFVKQ